MHVCSKCDRDHDRPVGLKCKYFLKALAICKELGAPEDDYSLHLDFSELDLEEDIAKLASGGGAMTGVDPIVKV